MEQGHGIRAAGNRDEMLLPPEFRRTRSFLEPRDVFFNSHAASLPPIGPCRQRPSIDLIPPELTPILRPMERRKWLGLCTRAGITALLPGCASQTDSTTTLRTEILQSRNHEGYGAWRNGRHLFSKEPPRPLPSLSITKSLAALAIVKAIGEGWLHVDEPLTDILPEWRSDSRKRIITLRMLVNQSAGFEAGVARLYRGAIRDKGQIAIGLQVVDPPGTRFRYGPASSEILGEILKRHLKIRGTTTSAYLTDLMRRIGISSHNWRRDLADQPYLSTGAEFSVRDLGRLGETISNLASGRPTAGLDPTIFRDLASPRAANPMVAAGLWWNRNAARSNATAIEPERHIDDVRPPAFWQQACLHPTLDPGWIAMAGSGGKRVYILPPEELVIVRLGRSRSWDDGAFLRSLTA